MIKKQKKNINWFAFSLALQGGCLYYFINIDLFQPNNTLISNIVVGLVSIVTMIILWKIVQRNFRKNDINVDKDLFIGIIIVYSFLLILNISSNNRIIYFMFPWLIFGLYYFVIGMISLLIILYYKYKNGKTKESVQAIVELTGFISTIISILTII